MKKFVVAVVIACALVLTTPALAQPSPAPVAAQESGRPWWRLAIFVPVSLLLGGGVVVVRRTARGRGWFGP
jgi:hypothetical protein